MFFNGYKMLFSFGIIVIMIIYFRIPITLNILYVIPSFIVLFVVTFACMTHLMHYGVFIQDLANVTNIVLRMVFYMTGIFYNIEKRLRTVHRDSYERESDGSCFEQSQKVYFIRAGTRCKVAYHMVYHRYYCCCIRSS